LPAASLAHAATSESGSWIDVGAKGATLGMGATGATLGMGAMGAVLVLGAGATWGCCVMSGVGGPGVRRVVGIVKVDGEPGDANNAAAFGA
jgi:hypothetical protein